MKSTCIPALPLFVGCDKIRQAMHVFNTFNCKLFVVPLLLIVQHSEGGLLL